MDERGTVEMLMEPLDRLVAVICDEVESLHGIDGELAELDEGTLSRAIAASEARGEDRSRRSLYLQGLDRMRELEDRRAMHFGTLLQAASLLQRTVTLGLSEVDAELLENNRITMALAALEEPRPARP
jgi:hypothetical protein